MSVITETWRQLVRRRLWPVAVLLVGALAAVPVLLASEPEPPVIPAPQETARAERTVASAEPLVALATEEDRDRRRRVLGVRKNPFQPAPTPEPKPVEPAQTPATAPVDQPAGAGGGAPAPPTGDGFVPPSAPPIPVTPPTTEPEKEKTHAPYELTVRFGEGSGGLERTAVERLEALPDADNPLLVYLGPGNGGRSAIFMVDAGVQTEGDASCDPDPSLCETIELREGETQFFDAVDESGAAGAQYQLDLLEIHPGPKKASKARAAKRAGRRALAAAAVSTGRVRVARVTGQVSAGL